MSRHPDSHALCPGYSSNRKGVGRADVVVKENDGT